LYWDSVRVAFIVAGFSAIHPKRVTYTLVTTPALMGCQLYYMTAQNDANMVNAIRYNAVVSCSSINSTI
jgi:hypothetical protein